MPWVKIKWRRLLVEPRTYVQEVDGDRVQLRIDGLVCSDVCAVRSRDALQSIEGVTDVEIDFETGIATIHVAPAEAATYDRAVRGVVVGGPARRALEHLSAAIASVFERRGPGRRGA